MHPQFTYDNQGNAIGVFLPIEDWKFIKDKHPDIDVMNGLPQWQKDILDRRRILTNQADQIISEEEFINSFDVDKDEI